MADGQQGIAISSGFTNSENDFVDKDYIQTILANALGNTPAERRYHGKPIFVLEAPNRGKYYMNITLDGWDQFSSLSDAEIETAYNNQVPEVSQAEAEAGIEVLVRRWSPLRVAQAIAALVGAAQNKLDAIIPPTVNNDQTEGYSVGSLWLDTVGNEYYRCSDPSTGAALWPKTTLTTDELAVVAVTGQYSDLLGIPIFAAVATSGDYGDLLNQPFIPSVAGNTNEIQVNNGGVFSSFTTFVWDVVNNILGIGTASPNSNSKLDIVSTTKGFSKPRMSTAQRTALGVLLTNVDADKGMEVYDLDTLSGFKWDGTQWVEDGTGGGVEERIMFDSNLDTVRVIYYNGVLTFGAFNIDAIIIDSLEFETSTDGATWTSHGTIAASGTPPVALNNWIASNGSGNWYLRLSVVYEIGETLPTGTQFTFER